MAGYSDFSKSNNAIDAEKRECYPLTLAHKVLARKLGWTQKKAKSFLLQFGSSEWHHTSSKYNITNYYDVSDDFITDFKEELKNYSYISKKEKRKEISFQSWNMESEKDCRKWAWTISSRVRSNLYSLDQAKIYVSRELESIQNEYEENLKKEKENIKVRSSTFRILSEKEYACVSILAEIEKAFKDEMTK